MKVIKRIMFFALLFTFVFANESIAQRRKLYKSQQLLKQETIIASIDSIVNTYWLDSSLDAKDFFELTNKNINGFLKSVRGNIEIKKICKCYLNKFNVAVNENDGKEVIKNGYVYILLNGKNNLDNVYTLMAKAYASEADKVGAEFIISLFKKFSNEEDGIYDSIIDILSAEIEPMLEPLEESVKGTWVCLNGWGKTYSGSTPSLILQINDLNKSNGCNLIPMNSNIKIQKEKGIFKPLFTRPIQTSQATRVNNKQRWFAAEFGSEKIYNGDAAFAHAGLDATRDFRAEMSGVIKSSNLNLGEKTGATIATNFISSVLDGLFVSSSISSRKFETFMLVMQKHSDVTIEANVSHIDAEIYSNGKLIESDRIEDKPLTFVKWEEGDNVMFVSANGKPITLTPTATNSNVLSEYKQIKHNYSFGNPKYLLPTLGGEIIGSALIFWGMNNMNKYIKLEDTESKNANRILTKTVVGILSGGLVCTLTPVLIWEIISSKRTKAYKKLNSKNCKKLQNKIQELSLMPNYNYIMNSVQLTMNCTF